MALFLILTQANCTIAGFAIGSAVDNASRPPEPTMTAPPSPGAPVAKRQPNPHPDELRWSVGGAAIGLLFDIAILLYVHELSTVKYSE